MEPSEKSSLINESVEYVYLLSYILANILLLLGSLLIWLKEY